MTSNDPERHDSVLRGQSVPARKGTIDFVADPQTGVATEAWTPRPPYAFKMSMFNVFCNSH